PVRTLLQPERDARARAQGRGHRERDAAAEVAPVGVAARRRRRPRRWARGGRAGGQQTPRRSLLRQSVEPCQRTWELAPDRVVRALPERAVHLRRGGELLSVAIAEGARIERHSGLDDRQALIASLRTRNRRVARTAARLPLERHQ